MARRRKGSVRMGPISIFSLVIALCLAVMAALSVSTALATYATTQRQASSTASAYEAEVAGQQFLAQVDAALEQVRQQGGGREEALAAMQSAVDELASAGASSTVSANIRVAAENASAQQPTLPEDADVTASFTCNDGRTLNVGLALTDSGTYQVLQWKTTTTWTEDTAGNKLWSGATDAATTTSNEE